MTFLTLLVQRPFVHVLHSYKCFFSLVQSAEVFRQQLQSPGTPLGHGGPHQICFLPQGGGLPYLSASTLVSVCVLLLSNFPSLVLITPPNPNPNRDSAKVCRDSHPHPPPPPPALPLRGEPAVSQRKRAADVKAVFPSPALSLLGCLISGLTSSAIFLKRVKDSDRKRDGDKEGERQ